MKQLKKVLLLILCYKLGSIGPDLRWIKHVLCYISTFYLHFSRCIIYHPRGPGKLREILHSKTCKLLMFLIARGPKFKTFNSWVIFKFIFFIIYSSNFIEKYSYWIWLLLCFVEKIQKSSECSQVIEVLALSSLDQFPVFGTDEKVSR